MSIKRLILGIVLGLGLLTAGAENDALKKGLIDTNALVNTFLNKKEPIEKRVKAVKALGKAGEKDKKVIEALNKGLKDKNEKIQMESALSLYKLNEGSPTAISVLNEFLKKGKGKEFLGELLKSECDGLFCKIVGLYDEENGKILLKNALMYDDEARAEAANWLAWLGEHDLAYPILVECLKNSKNVNAREWALQGLAEIADERSLEAIKIGLNDKDKQVREIAQYMFEYVEATVESDKKKKEKGE